MNNDDPPTPPDAPLRPATAEEVEETLSFGLRYDGRKRVHHADEIMARVTAERLARILERSGIVCMKRAAAPAPSTSPHHRRREP